jgi:hypothetical protein
LEHAFKCASLECDVAHAIVFSLLKSVHQTSVLAVWHTYYDPLLLLLLLTL